LNYEGRENPLDHFTLWNQSSIVLDSVEILHAEEFLLQDWSYPWEIFG